MVPQHLLRQRGSRIQEQVQKLFMVRRHKVSKLLCYNCCLNIGCDVTVEIFYAYKSESLCTHTRVYMSTKLKNKVILFLLKLTRLARKCFCGLLSRDLPPANF